jgi:hypothetical protein
MEPAAAPDNQLETALEALQAVESRLREVTRYMLAVKELYPMDLLTTAVLNRSLSLMEGFIVLVRANNSLAGLHLVRLQLDSLLRYSAAWLVNEPHVFAAEVLSGARIDKLKDRTGADMRDAYLVKELAKEHPWVSSVYSETSGYVHLSEKHFHSSTRRVKGAERGTIQSVIAKDDRFIPDYLKIEAAEAMLEITTQICGYAYGWADTKHGGHLPQV